jgi:hypothetical protein
VFGNQGVTYNGGTISGGLLGSNGDVNVGVFSTLAGVSGGGALNVPSAGFVTINGPVSVNGDVTMGVFGTINGNVEAGGNVSMSGIVNGNVKHGGSFSTGFFGSVNGSVQQAPAGFKPFAKVTVPGATSFTAGGPNENVPTFDNVTLQPGKYGDLTFGSPPFGSATLNLSSGKYFFSSISANGSAFNTLNLNLTKGPIEIFVTGNVDLGGAFTTLVNGNAASSANSALASQVLLESLGNVSASGFFTTTTFFGTIFTPNGDINTGFDSSVIGSLVAGHSINASSTSVTDVSSSLLPTSTTAPVPQGLVLMGMGLPGLFALVRRRRKQTL